MKQDSSKQFSVVDERALKSHRTERNKFKKITRPKPHRILCRSLLTRLCILQTTQPHPREIKSWQVTILTALIAAILALLQAAAKLVQRLREMRWKKLS